jgi:hypothetical protein
MCSLPVGSLPRRFKLQGVPVVEGKGPQEPVGDIATNLVLENTPLTGLKEAQVCLTPYLLLSPKSLMV